MRPLAAEQLAERLIKSEEEAFPKVPAEEIIAVTAAIMFLKRAADQPGQYPIFDNDPLYTIRLSKHPDRELNRLLSEVIGANSNNLGARTIDFNISWNLKANQIRQFADSIADIALSDSDLEFP